MKRATLVLVALLMLVTISAFAQVTPTPALMNFQGRLAKPDGTPLTDGTYSVTFSLWNTASAGSVMTNQLWAETDNITVHNGSFAILLGSTTVFGSNVFNGNLWLQVQVGTNVPLAPRQQIVSVAFALKANTVPDGSITDAKIASGLDFGKLANVPDTLLTLPFSRSVNSSASLFSVTSTGIGYALVGQNAGGSSAIRGAAVNGGIGVDASSDSSTAVYAISNTGSGVEGFSTSGGGVYGETSSGFAGVEGVNNTTEDNGGYGVYGGSAHGFGVFGATSQGLAGVAGVNSAIGVYGVFGRNDAGIGILGENNPGFLGTPGIGVKGLSSTGYGIYGTADENGGTGVYGELNGGSSYGVYGTSTNGYAIYGVSTGGDAGYFAGKVIVTGTFSNPSDARYKTNVVTLGNALDDVLNLRGVTYDYKRDAFKAMNFPEGKQIGFIAQELEKVFPELVTTGKDGYKSVNYVGVVPILVEAVKTQQKQLNDTRKQLEDKQRQIDELRVIKTENTELKKRNTEIEKQLAALVEAVRKLQEEHNK